MYILRNNEERSYKHCCNEKSINTAYSKTVFVALIIQHGMRMHHIAVCGLPRSTNFFHHYLITGTIFGKMLLITKCVF
jgi:hypothetical protein